MPVTYKEWVDPADSNLVKGHILKDWITRFEYADEDLKQSGIASEAMTVDPDTYKILATGQFLKKDTEGIWITETHYRDEKPIFQARSRFSSFLGIKNQEEVIEGEKEQDFYPFWPVRTGP